MRLIRPRFATRNRAFTFIEIMLVVLIIGILMAVVVPNMVGKAKKARIAVAKRSIESYETALAQFEMGADRFPTTEEGLQALVKKPEDLNEDQWNGPYVKEVLPDPWGQEFVYRSPGESGDEYDLFSKGPDKQEGTSDDVYKRDRKDNE